MTSLRSRFPYSFSALMRRSVANALTTPRIYWYAIRMERRKSAAVVVCQAGSGILQGAALLLLVPVLNETIGGSTQPGILATLRQFLAESPRLGALVLTGGFVILGLLAAGLKLVADSISSRVRVSVEQQLTEKILDAMRRISWEAFLDLQLGSLAKVMLTDALRFAEGTEKLIRAIGFLTVASILLLVAIWTMPVCTLVVTALALVGSVGFRAAYWNVRTVSQQRAAASKVAADKVVEIASHWKYLRASGTDEASVQAAKRACAHLADKHVAMAFANDKLQFGLEIGAVLVIGICLAYGFLAPGVNFTNQLVVLGIFTRLVPQIIQAQRAYNIAKDQQFAAMGWLELYGRLSDGAEPSSGNVSPTYDRAIEMRSVSYAYPGGRGAKSGVREISLVLPKGRSIAIVGESGAGKSTLLDLLTGLLKPTSGKICLDGVPLEDIDITQWRKRIGVVQQNCPLFYGTILENIAFGATSPDIPRAIHCAELACVMNFIKGLPDGLHTMIGENGAKLSGGQRQRIAVARALYHEPWLLILDEPTSALDAENERFLMETMESLKGKLTILLVTHRHQALSIADELIYMQDGAIVNRSSGKQTDRAILSAPTLEELSP
jgi:ATP-binding cassette, subfamily C, bacterial